MSSFWVISTQMAYNEHTMRLPTLVSMLALVAACGPTVVSVPTLSPTIAMPESPTSGSYELNIAGFSDDAICSKMPDIAELPELCVADLRTEVEAGLRGVLDAHFDGKGKAYQAKFRFKKFAHEKKGLGVGVSFAWELTFVDPDDNPLLMLDEVTEGSAVINESVDADTAVTSALNAVLDQVSHMLAAEL